MRTPRRAKNALNMKLFVVTLTAENKTKVIGLYTLYEQAMRDLVLTLIKTDHLSYDVYEDTTSAEDTSLVAFRELMVRECADEKTLIENLEIYGDANYHQTWSFEITSCYSINKIFN